MRRTFPVGVAASISAVMAVSGCASSPDTGAPPDTNCHPQASRGRSHATLALSYLGPTPHLRVSLGSLVTVTAGPYKRQDLTFPGTRGSPVACRISGHRMADGAIQVVLLARHPGRLNLASGELHPTPAMDPAFVGILIVQ